MIRQIVPDDAAAERLAELERAAFPDRLSSREPAHFLRFRDQKGALILGDAPPYHAYLLLQIAADEAEIVDIGVMPDARRAGLGRALVEAALAAATTQGAVRALLEVAVDNAPACALYDRLGFEQVGMRKGYYARPDNGRVDALILARAI